MHWRKDMKSKFIDSLIKLSQELFSKSMADRYKHLHTDYSEGTSNETKSVDTTPRKSPQRSIGLSLKDSYNLSRKPSGSISFKSPKVKEPTFTTATTSKTFLSPKNFDYINFSKNTKFKDISSYIVDSESGGKHYKSLKPNKDGTWDYGFYQINDSNLSRKTSGGKLADEWDPIFEKYYQHYNTNLSGKTLDGVSYAPLPGKDSLDVNTRRALLQLPHKDYNDSSAGMGYELSKALYGQRGIGQWSSKDKIISKYTDANALASQ